MSSSRPPFGGGPCTSLCYPIFQEEMTLGMVPAICLPDSTFSKNYQSCGDCVVTNTAAAPMPYQSFIPGMLIPYLNYCASLAQSSTSGRPSATISSQLAVASSQLSQAAKISSYAKSLQTATAQVVASQNSTVFVTQTSIVAQTPVLGLATTSPLSPPSDTSAASLHSAETFSSTRKTWIAGAVLGPIILLILIGAFFFYKRRQKKRQQENIVEEQPPISALPHESYTEPYEEYKYQAQLHGDSFVVHELDSPRPIGEDEKVELPAREPVGVEMEGWKINRWSKV